MMYSPYNNTREFKPWGGEDCSYLFPYAGGVRSMTGVLTLLWYWVVLAALIAVVNCSSQSQQSLGLTAAEQVEQSTSSTGNGCFSHQHAAEECSDGFALSSDVGSD